MQKVLWQKYVWERQTVNQLSQKYNRSNSWIRQQLENYQAAKKKIKPCPVVIVADMTFVKRTFGIAVIRAPYLKKNLVWKMAKTENAMIYRELRWELEQQGFEIKAAVIDGKPGLIDVFHDVPIQMCHFHQIAIMTRYLTTKPKLLAGQTLRHIAFQIPKSTKTEIEKMLDEWNETWKEFLKEKTLNLETKRWHYTHKRLRSAYRSLRKNLLMLYTFQKFPELKIPNTTNFLDGTFSHLKDMLRIHRGLKSSQKLKIIDEFLSK